MTNNMKSAGLLIKCPDKKGLIQAFTSFIAEHGGNILELEQFVDKQVDGFFMRVLWDMANFDMPLENFSHAFAPMAERLKVKYQLFDNSRRMRMGLMVSKEFHCLAELLLQVELGNLNLDVPVIIGNHPQGQQWAEKFNIPFKYTPTEGISKQELEAKQLEILKQHEVDSIGLARYMQILSGDFVSHYSGKIINIHHSFLPAFVGANPYRQAFDAGVKMIGATSHFVTKDLDMGAIIVQDSQPIHHGYSVRRLRNVGQEIERKVFIKAIKKYLEHKIICHENRTIVFE